jgi:hypothetical protein
MVGAAAGSHGSGNGVPTAKEEAMCEQKKGCQKPEALQGDPKECSPEQISECHGDVKEHSCEERREDE